MVRISLVSNKVCACAKQAIYIKASESPAPIASNVVGGRPEPLTLYSEMLALRVSRTLKLLMTAQLVLLLLLGPS
jgi:hypothetical protein